MHQSKATSLLLSKALPQWPYLQWPYLRWPYLQGSGQVLSSRSLLGLLKLSNKCVTNQFRMELTRTLKELSLSLVASIINPAKQEQLRCMRLLFLRCGLNYKGYYLFLSEHQAYMVLQDLQERYGSPGRLVATIIESLELFLQGQSVFRVTT